MTPKKVFSRIGLALFCMLVVQQVIAAVITTAITLITPTITEQGLFIWVISYVPLYLIAFPVFLGIAASIPTWDITPPAPVKPTAGQMLKLIPMSIAVAYVLNLLATALSSLVEVIRGRGIANPLESVMTGSDVWINLLCVVIIAPIMEEIIFRRILYRKLIGFGSKVYIFFSAFMFAAFHANFYQLAYAFVLGIIFAVLTHYSGTIKYSIILHMVINFSMGGLGSVLMSMNNDLVLSVYGFIVIALVVIGVIFCIQWFRKERQNHTFTPGVVPAPTKGEIFGNVGMILYLALIILITLFNIFLT